MGRLKETAMHSFKKFIIIHEAKNNSCPTATYDIHTNLENRQHAIEEYLYGPANPEKPGDYWKKLADVFHIDEKTATSMTCSNCGAFDVSDKMRECISNGIKGDESGVDAWASVNVANLGYCNFLHFKCAGSRSCKAWITGGPVYNKDRTE